GDLQVLVEDDRRLFNQYGVMLVGRHSSTGWSRQRARGPSPITRSTASSYFIRTQPIPTRKREVSHEVRNCDSRHRCPKQFGDGSTALCGAAKPVNQNIV